jgi:hypothetical protein
MANINTKRRRNAGENGYGKKRGRALLTGLGQLDGSPTRKTPWKNPKKSKTTVTVINPNED